MTLALRSCKDSHMKASLKRAPVADLSLIPALVEVTLDFIHYGLQAAQCLLTGLSPLISRKMRQESR